MTRSSTQQFVLILALSLICFTPMTANAQSPGAQSSPPLKRIAGIGTHYAQHDGLPEQDMPVIRQLGFTHLRDEMYWRVLEKEKGKLQMPPEYDAFVKAAEAKGVGVLLALNYGNKHYDGGSYPTSEEGIEAFCRYAEFVARHFKGRVKYYEIWNEWDLGLGVPRRADGRRDAGAVDPYVTLAKAVYPRLKKIDPSITVLAGASADSGTFGGWLERGVSLGLLDACDGLSFHPYNRPNPPEECLHSVEALVPKLRAAADKAGSNKPLQLYITEIGWPTEVGNNKSVSPRLQGAFLARMMLLMATVPEFKGIWWFNFQHIGAGYAKGDGESTYGIVYPDLTLTPAAAAAEDVAPLLAHADFIERLKTDSENVIALRFKRPGGKEVIAVWSTAPDDNWQLKLKTTRTQRGEVAIRTAGGNGITRTWGERRHEKQPDGAVRTVLDPTTLAVTVRDMPVLIEGDLGDITAATVRKVAYPELLRGIRGYPNVPDEIATAAPATTGPATTAPAGTDRVSPSIPFPLFDAQLKDIERSDADCSASFTTRYTSEAIELTITVTDDVHLPDTSGDRASAWKGDSLQVAFMDLQTPADPNRPADRATGRYTGLVLSVDPDGQTRVHREVGSAPAETFGGNVTREQGKTIYRLRIPAAIYDRDAWRAGDKLAISLLVNDADGPAGRKATLGWGNGIGRGKDPSKFNWILLQP